MDVRAYGEEVLRRFTNPALGRTTQKVGTDGSQKLGPRLLGRVQGATAPEGVVRALLGETEVFPAEPAGGATYLKAIAGPVQDVVFCPTGGISETNAPEYLGLGNVACVGGSWLTPQAAVAAGDYAEITRRAQAAASLG